MPTFNDSQTICESMNSIINQSYKNWELIIVDDGSTDLTKNIVEKYKVENDQENKIKYIYQTNQDQLNAILNGSTYANGDYIYIAHSDDVLNGNDILDKCVKYMENHQELEAIISDLITINETGDILGVQKTQKYLNKKYMLPLMELWLGRNLYVDVAFYRRDIFFNKVKKTYLTWNMPFWLDLENSDKLLKVKKVPFPIMRYRIGANNYINNSIGQLNVINGELRTLTTLMADYNIILYKIQYYIFRLFNKLKIRYVPIYTKKPQKKSEKIVSFVIKKRFKNEYEDNLFLKSLSEFFFNRQNRVIEIKEELFNNSTIYYGKDMRKFNNALLNGNLEDIYLFIFSEMQKGFSEILVNTELNKEKLTVIAKFLCIFPYIKITVKGE